MAESFNSFFGSKFIYTTRNEHFPVDAALTCAQQVKRLSQKLFNSEGIGTLWTMRQADRITSRSVDCQYTVCDMEILKFWKKLK